jgi:hypothetical protein
MMFGDQMEIKIIQPEQFPEAAKVMDVVAQESCGGSRSMKSASWIH